jgi:hypothetical protein
MLGRSAHLILFLAAAVPSLVLSAPANGQCRLCNAPTVIRDEESAKGEVRLEVETSPNFDRLIVLGQGEGSAVLRPDGSTSSGGTMAEVSPRAMAGTVTVHGEPGRAIRIDLPRRILLHSLSGGEVSFDDVTSDLPSMPRLDSAGNLRFRFGGRLKVSGDADGDYRGDFPITAEYL